MTASVNHLAKAMEGLRMMFATTLLSRPFVAMVTGVLIMVGGCQSPPNASRQGVGPLATSMPIGSSVNRKVAFAAAKVIAPGAPDFPSGPAISAYFGESLIGCTVSHAKMTAFSGVPEGTPLMITGVVGQHNFLGVWLLPSCTIAKI
jgi:hypothetical protein